MDQTTLQRFDAHDFHSASGLDITTIERKIMSGASVNATDGYVGGEYNTMPINLLAILDTSARYPSHLICDVARLLLRHKADVNGGRNMNRPIQLAAWYPSHPELIQVLEEHGAEHGNAAAS